MSESVLSTRALNRALLARQHLLARSRPGIVDVVEQVCGIQMQHAPSAYIGLWSRIEGFERDDLTRALEDRRLVQATSLRATIHLLSAADYRIFSEAIRSARQAWWLRVSRHSVDEVERAAPRLRALLANGPRRRAELVEELGVDSATWNGLQLWVDLVRVPPSGTWERRRADLFGLASSWMGQDRNLSTPEGEAIDQLVTSYLTGFGPAGRKDISAFTGLPATALRPSLSRLPLRTFLTEEGTELLDVEDGMLPDPETPAPVRLLPTWDAPLLVHARRTQILPEEYRPRIFNTRTPHSVNSFLVDGQVAGTWKVEKGRVRLEPFHELPSGARRQLDEEAEGLATFIT